MGWDATKIIYWYNCYNEDKKLYYFHGFSIYNSDIRTCFIKHQNCMTLRSVGWCVCLSSTLYFNCWTRFCGFSYYYIDNNLFQSLCLPCLEFWRFFVLIDCLNTYNEIPIIQILFTDYLFSYNRHLKMSIIWCKNRSPSPFMT